MIINKTRTSSRAAACPVAFHAGNELLVPSAALVDGTRMPITGFGELETYAPQATAQKTVVFVDALMSVVVDDTPGSRSWSPPV